MKNLMLKVLNDTVKYYSKDMRRRSVKEDGGCQYFIKGKNGCPNKMCAIGRYIMPSKRLEANENGGMWVDSKHITPLLKKEVRDIPLKFWTALQDLHDSPDYWGVKNREKLESRVDLIKGKIERGIYR